MTLARPVGAYPTGPIPLHRRISRGSAFAAAGVLAALNAQADQIINILRYQSLASAITGLAGISAVIWVAMYAALRIGLEDDSSGFRRRDGLVLAIVILLSFLPISFAAKAGLLGCSLYLFATSRTGDPGWRASLVLLALTGPLIWGRILLHLFALQILAVDARLVASVTGSPVDGNLVRSGVETTRMLIGGPCSSVHNMSLAVLLWTTAAVFLNIRIDRRYVWAGAAMVGFMFVLNVARLSAIALFPGQYELLHIGAGATAFGWAGLIGAGLIAFKGVVDAAERQR